MEKIICTHEVDRSLLKSGFTFTIEQRDSLKKWFGELKRGQERTITLLMNGKPYLAVVRNVDLDREKFADETDRWQLRYDGYPIVDELGKIFAVSRKHIEQVLLKREQDPTANKKAHIDMPADRREELAFYRTPIPTVWQVVPHLAEVAVGSLLQRVAELEDRVRLLEGRLGMVGAV